MITKKHLVQDREQANVAFLQLKQKYNPGDNKCFFIVEGKDDTAFYDCISLRYSKFGTPVILSADGRKNVLHIYNSTDWSVFSKKRVFFFVDRDLSDITGEYTPVSQNVYVTDDYSIENSLFNEALLFSTLKYFCGLHDLNTEETAVLSNLFQTAKNAHAQLFFPIMSWIVYWRIMGINCILNNLNKEALFQIDQGVFEINDEYLQGASIESFIHKVCEVEYFPRDIAPFSEMIKNHGGITKNIRGKYVRTFFVKFLNSIIDSLPAILPGRRKPKAIITFGYSNILQILCGYMATPKSLDLFLSKANP